MDENTKKKLIKERLAPVEKERYYTKIKASSIGFLQIDLMIMDKESKYNKGFSYGFCIIDIYSRYGDCIPIKDKSSSECVRALKSFIDNFKHKIAMVICDDDKAFKGSFEKLLDREDIFKNVVDNKIDDHHTLGMVDRFILTLRKKLLPYWIENGKPVWVKYMKKIIEEYNSDIHRTIKARPIDVYNGIAEPYNPKILKSIKDELKQGDKVRILVKKKLFDKKSSTQNWSDNVYTVKEKNGFRWYLEEIDGRYPRWALKKSEFSKDNLRGKLMGKISELKSNIKSVRKIKKSFNLKTKKQAENLQKIQKNLGDIVFEKSKRKRKPKVMGDYV